LKCGEPLGFVPDRVEMATVKNLQLPNPQGVTYRTCANREPHHVCNWMIPSTDNHTFCLACRLNSVIPDLTVNGNLERWNSLELAKRQCLYTLLHLGLSIQAPADGKFTPLQFRFLADTPDAPVFTGHENGMITINIVEADSFERERRRSALHEPYRTLVGHFRHESGHYYWDQLIANSPHLQPFRDLFGDESVSYDEALKLYYKQGPATDWQDRSVSAYSTLHPWEDWAETWAHYLHIVDTMETAASFGLGLEEGGGFQPVINPFPAGSNSGPVDFDQLHENWIPITLALNAVNRSMGLPDLYPFVISPKAVEKLRFVHDVIQSESRRTNELPTPQYAVK
jgi:hypothetical protein